MSFLFGFVTAVVVVPMARAFVEGWMSWNRPRPLKRPRRKTRAKVVEKYRTILVPGPSSFWCGQRPFGRGPD